MVSTHCGQSLKRLTRDSDHTNFHRWRCEVCKRVFSQKKRLPAINPKLMLRQ